MIKLLNDSGKCIWIYGTTSINYKRKAIEISGLKKMCPKLKTVIKSMAIQALETAISAGYSTLYSVEKGNDEHRIDIIVNISLPVCLHDAVNTVMCVQRDNGVEF